MPACRGRTGVRQMALIKSYLRDTSSYMRIPLEHHPPTDPLLEPEVTTAIRDTPSCCHILIHIISRQKEAIVCLHYQTGADSHNRWCDTVQFEDAWFCIQSRTRLFQSAGQLGLSCDCCNQQSYQRLTNKTESRISIPMHA